MRLSHLILLLIVYTLLGCSNISDDSSEKSVLDTACSDIDDKLLSCNFKQKKCSGKVANNEKPTLLYMLVI